MKQKDVVFYWLLFNVSSMSVIFMTMTSLKAAPRSELQRMVSVWKQRAILCTRYILSGTYPTGDMCIWFVTPN